jgi:hypothetical protein
VMVAFVPLDDAGAIGGFASLHLSEDLCAPGRARRLTLSS